MCFAVTGWNRTASIDTASAGTNPQKNFYIVYVRITNRSRGRAQREIGRKGVLIDQSGRVLRGIPGGHEEDIPDRCSSASRPWMLKWSRAKA